MGTKAKGFLKGLHKISNMFDGKEPEMQIGFPTDVKHVAHIGWDGPSVNPNPGWMNELRSVNSAPLPCTASSNNGSGNELAAAAPLSPKWSSQEFLVDLGANASSPKEASPAPAPSAKPPKRNTSSDPAPSADGEPAAAVPKHSRRHKSSSDSPSRGESSEGSRRGRRERKSASAGSGGSDSSATAQDAPGVPKQSSRRKKVAKDSASSGGSRSKDVKSASADRGSEQLPASPVKEEGNNNENVRENSSLCVP